MSIAFPQPAWVRLPQRTVLRFKGADRQKFVHNFCTNQVRELKPGQGVEAFVTDVRGHTIGHVHLLASPEELLLTTVPGQGPLLHKHLDRYLIREQVEIHDVTEQTVVWLLIGEELPTLLTNAGAWPNERLTHTTLSFAAHSVQVTRVDWLLQPAWECLAPVAAQVACEQWFGTLGIASITTAQLESARLMAGTPWFGCDITPENLPQEIQRDRQAISFTKGCYLGQETVARIDALGQVNKLLVPIQCEQGGCHAGQELTVEGKTVGTITSLAPAIDGPAQIGLALVRRVTAKPGTVLNAGAQLVHVR